MRCLRHIVLVLLLPVLALANGGDDDLTTINENLLTGGDSASSLVGGDHKSIALAPGSLGDVDIYGCRASTAYTIFILWSRQSIEIDPLCVADKYDAAGKYALAAQLRCTVPLIADLNYAGTTCTGANNFEPPGEPNSPEPFATVGLLADSEERQTQHVTEYDARLTEITERLDREQSRRVASNRRYEAEQKKERDFNAAFLVKFRQVTEGEVTESDEDD